MKSKLILTSILLLMAISGLKAQIGGIGPVVALTGNVINELSKEPESVFMMVLNEKGKRVNATRSNKTDNGYYYLTGLKPGKTYQIVIRQKGFMKELIEMTIPKTKKYLEISHDFLVKPLEMDAKFKLPVAPFELNKSKIRFGADFLLEELVSTLKNNENVNFQIVSYPDNNDTPEENSKLTAERADALKNFFKEQGIDETRMTTKGHNSTDPDNPPPTKKRAKGKRYVGYSYIVITEIKQIEKDTE